MNIQKIWDKEEALLRFGGSVEILEKIGKIFLHEYSLQLQNLQDAIEEKNFRDIQFYAHSIKDSAGDLGATQLYTQIHIIEQNSKKKLLPTQEQMKNFLVCSTQTLKEITNYIQNNKNNNKKMVYLSKEEILILLTKLYTALENGDFLESENLEIFQVKFSSTLEKEVQILRQEIDEFKTNNALKSIENIIIGLDT